MKTVTDKQVELMLSDLGKKLGDAAFYFYQTHGIDEETFWYQFKGTTITDKWKWIWNFEKKYGNR